MPAGYNQRRKHIDVKHRFLREQALGVIIELAWVSTAADVFTKPLPFVAFDRHRRPIMNNSDGESSPIATRPQTGGSVTAADTGEAATAAGHSGHTNG